MSPGDPSTLTGRAAPSGSRAEQGRSVFAEPPTVSWLFRRALRSQLESNKTRPFFALSPAPLPCTPVRATCSLGEVTLSAGPQGGRACHPPPPAPSSLPDPGSAGSPAEPLSLRSPISGARPGRPRAARVYTERFPCRTNTSLCSASRGQAVSPLPDNGMAISDQRCSLESE